MGFPKWMELGFLLTLVIKIGAVIAGIYLAALLIKALKKHL